MREAYATRLGSVHLPGDARRTHVRRSRHLLFTTRRSRAVESPKSRVRCYCGSPNLPNSYFDSRLESNIPPIRYLMFD
ncbi:hypothetical protein CRG98_020531 [Punica granatum]|uniref:Uncharacterized protein n=1 Tax=Punica granatum TaxID=22663 RepID=A0A2I0JUD0_PUNGR|nr:hypothetical protein CRG98_020531 [Punica granatum]